MDIRTLLFFHVVLVLSFLVADQFSLIRWFNNPTNNSLQEIADDNELDSNDSFENSSYSDDHNYDGSEDLESEDRGYTFASKQKKLDAGSDSFEDENIRYKFADTGSDSCELPETFKQHLTDFRMKCQEIVEYLKPLADETDKVYKDLKTSKVVGSAAGFVGDALKGCARPFVVPFGASRGFTNSGGLTEGSALETVTVSAIADAVKSSAIGKRAAAAVQELNEIREELVKDCNILSKQIGSPEYIEVRCPCWVEFWSKFIFGATHVPWQLTMTVVNSVMNGTRIADLSADIARSGGIALFRLIGTASCLHKNGGVFGALLMPLDIYTLIVSGIESHKARKGNDKKKTKHRVSGKIRETTQALTKACPTDEDIENLLSEFGQK